MKNQRAFVYYGNKKAGVLWNTNDSYVFEYDANYIKDSNSRPISLSFPLTDKKFRSEKLFPFFEGLLPEGWLLAVTSKSLKIDVDDKFGLLLHVGKDTIGAVSIIPEENNRE